ncbi:hypothetical protein MATL_G00193430 [Megalops atlanticus]|uniref:RING-type domain-containing protein n=1 Tax=Megalops atlanticus TaxID=7932 RepID=A0A9D3PJ86_MEGAT|nr:hypothetical protein MATL_G00193430 [Megalops atlanticus]
MDGLSHELTCSVCLEILENPYLLPCGHSFCLTCVQGLRNAMEFKCPDCRRECRQWDDIVKNFRLANIVEVYRKEKHQSFRTETSSDTSDGSWVIGLLLMAAVSLMIYAFTLTSKVDVPEAETLDSLISLKIHQVGEDETTQGTSLTVTGLCIIGHVISLPYWCCWAVISSLCMLCSGVWWIVSSLCSLIFGSLWMVISALLSVIAGVFSFVFGLFNVIVYICGIVAILFVLLLTLGNRIDSGNVSNQGKC